MEKVVRAPGRAGSAVRAWNLHLDQCRECTQLRETWCPVGRRALDAAVAEIVGQYRGHRREKSRAARR